MATRQGVNPYARPIPPDDGSAPNPSGNFVWGGPGRYAVADVPESTDPDYRDGFSPELVSGGSPDGSALPSDIRIGRREPPPNDPNDHAYTAKRNSDFHKRHSDEHYADNWKVRQQKAPAGQNPMWTQERPPIRPTAEDSPTGYAFTRPWHIPRNIKDAIGENAVAHFSLADHRRNFEIFGMKPQGGVGANTYRADPRPWDEGLFTPPQADGVTSGFAGNRNYRLGG